MAAGEFLANCGRLLSRPVGLKSLPRAMFAGADTPLCSCSLPSPPLTHSPLEDNQVGDAGVAIA